MAANMAEAAGGSGASPRAALVAELERRGRARLGCLEARVTAAPGKPGRFIVQVTVAAMPRWPVAPALPLRQAQEAAAVALVAGPTWAEHADLMAERRFAQVLEAQDRARTAWLRAQGGPDAAAAAAALRDAANLAELAGAVARDARARLRQERMARTAG